MKISESEGTANQLMDVLYVVALFVWGVMAGSNGYIREALLCLYILGLIFMLERWSK